MCVFLHIKWGGHMFWSWGLARQDRKLSFSRIVSSIHDEHIWISESEMPCNVKALRCWYDTTKGTFLMAVTLMDHSQNAGALDPLHKLAYICTHKVCVKHKWTSKCLDLGSSLKIPHYVCSRLPKSEMFLVPSVSDQRCSPCTGSSTLFELLLKLDTVRCFLMLLGC